MAEMKNGLILRTVPLLIAAGHCEQACPERSRMGAPIKARMFAPTAILLLTLVASATAKYGGGSGTANDPYKIAAVADLIALGETPEDYGKHFILTDDIDLDPNIPGGKVFDKAVIAPDTDQTTYWFQGTSFTGVFDANDHKISHLTITGVDFLGLFGKLEAGAEVKDLGLVDVNVVGTGYCYYVGGLVGSNGDFRQKGGTITGCYSTGAVSGEYFVGGLVGENYDGSISNCCSTGDVNGEDSVGGLVGWNGSDSVSNCYSTGDVSGHYNVGGLVGVNGDVGAVPPRPCHIVNSYSTGDVNGVGHVGGLVGLNGDSISNCYSIGDVSGSKDVGGLVGTNGAGGRPFYPGQIINSYSTGSVQGASDVGGLVGYNKSGGIGSSFWDVETSSEPNMCGYQDEEYATGCDPNCGKTTAEMQTGSTFTDSGWDFVNVWGIGENQTYPYLRKYSAADVNQDGSVNFLDLAAMAENWLGPIAP